MTAQTLDTSVETILDGQYKVDAYLGDCAHIIHKIPERSVDLVITSPPYNLGKS